MKAKEALKKTAAESGVTEEEMLRDITAAIEAAMQNASPEAAQMWSSIAGNGKTPTAEELVEAVGEKILPH